MCLLLQNKSNLSLTYTAKDRNWMTNKIFFFSCIISIFLVPQVFAIGDSSAGAKKIQTCSFCHGPNGNSVTPVWPKLAGQHAQYIVKQLQLFKSGERDNPQMSPLASTLSDQDMEDIAAYYAEQPVSKSLTESSIKKEDIELGQKIYRAGNINKGVPACMACHGPNAKGNMAAIYPNLAGQHAAYTAAQLLAFKNESRANSPNNVMVEIASKLSQDEIHAVSQYLQGL